MMLPSLDDIRLTPRVYAALALLCALLFLPGQAQLPAIDRDEARFAQASKQMVMSGDYTDIKFQAEPRYKKPIGIYWLQAAAVNITGAGPSDIWAYRLPSYLAAIASVLLTAAIGARLFSPAVGLLAALMLMGSLILNVEARMAKTDAMLLFTVLAAQYALLTLWKQGRHLGWAGIFWAAVAAGALVKGPVILLPVLATLIAISWKERSPVLLKNLQPLWGLPLCVALIAPWFIAITLKTGGDFWAASLGHDMLGKVAGGKESHGLPPGYYLVTFWGTFWPAAPLIALALPAIWKQRRDATIFTLLAWVVPTWLVFELVPTKLPHYTLPAFPALAILAAAAWQNGWVRYPTWWGRVCAIIFAAVTIGLAGGFAALPIVANGHIPVAQLTAGIAAAIALLWFWRPVMELKRLALASLLSCLFLGTLFGITLPRWDYIWIARQVEDALESAAPDCPGHYVASAVFNEPSLVFTVGTQTTLDTNGSFAAAYASADACQFALIDKANEDAFQKTAAAIGYTPHALAHIAGFSYGGGDPVDMTLYVSHHE